jgi:primosomal protein N' (replication factor Y)
LPPVFLQAVIDLAGKIPDHNVQLLGPVTAPMAKRAGLHRYQLLLQSTHRRDLQTLLTTLIPQVAKLKLTAKVRWSLDVDPVDLY